MKMKNKYAASFGSYGWSGESVKMINEELTKAGFTLIDEGFKTLWTPDEDVTEKLREYGRNFAAKLQE
jgi:flavorubredoxin